MLLPNHAPRTAAEQFATLAAPTPAGSTSGSAAPTTDESYRAGIVELLSYLSGSHAAPVLPGDVPLSSRGCSRPAPQGRHWPESWACQSRSRTISARRTPSRHTHRLASLADETAADELMLTTTIHDPAARQRSFDLLTRASGAVAVTDR
jgi:hypothetical protein